MAQKKWNVYLKGNYIDSVFFNPEMSEEDVKRALVEHDGFDPSITVRPSRCLARIPKN